MRVLVYQSQQHGSHRQAWHTCICYRSLLGGGSSSAEADHAALLGAALRGHHRTPVPPPPPPPPKSKCAEGHASCTPTPACLAKAHALHTACLQPPPPSHTHAQSKPTSWFTVGDPPPTLARRSTAIACCACCACCRRSASISASTSAIARSALSSMLVSVSYSAGVGRPRWVGGRGGGARHLSSCSGRCGCQ